MNRLKLLATLMIVGTLGVLATPSVKVSTKIDSVLVMQGALRRVDVEVVQPSNLNARWLSDPADSRSIVELVPGVEVNYSSEIDTTDLGNDRLQLNRTLLIQAWDSGEVVIPGIILVADADTFVSNPLAFKVLTADIDSMQTIHSWMPAVKQSRHFWDFVPDWLYNWWWVILLAIVAVAAGVAAYIIYRKGGISQILVSEPEPVPPYEKAMSQLQILRTRQLCEKGREKEYYTELTEILRQYLEGRFGINAMEMTTSQIKRAVYATVPEKAATSMMSEILEMADYVKFAKMRPLPEDNDRAFNQATAFVEHTKPEDVAPETSGKEARK